MKLEGVKLGVGRMELEEGSWKKEV